MPASRAWRMIGRAASSPRLQGCPPRPGSPKLIPPRQSLEISSPVEPSLPYSIEISSLPWSRWLAHLSADVRGQSPRRPSERRVQVVVRTLLNCPPRVVVYTRARPPSAKRNRRCPAAIALPLGQMFAFSGRGPRISVHYRPFLALRCAQNKLARPEARGARSEND